MSEWLNEPDIVVNGEALSPGQAAALRVACTDFQGLLCRHSDALGTDEHGRRMREAYLDRIEEVLQLMVGRVMI